FWRVRVHGRRLRFLLDYVSFFCKSHIMRKIPARVYRYGNNSFKIVYLKHSSSGARPSEDEKCPENDTIQAKCPENDTFFECPENYTLDTPSEKEDCNVRRARSAITELALCNEWDYFVTLTLSPEKFDRHDLHKWQKALSVWIGNFNKKHDCKLKYLLIPEHHQDGCWHMHGLLSGIPSECLVINEYGYLDFPEYAERFGFINLGKVKDPIRVARYITKYVSKQLSERSQELGAHLYYHSRGLARKELVAEYAVSEVPFNAQQNDFCGWEWFDGACNDVRSRVAFTKSSKFAWFKRGRFDINSVFANLPYMRTGLRFRDGRKLIIKGKKRPERKTNI
ncbi:MAG: hypothetical protein ACI4XF_00350, partial [Oscillospiraceae bacterium]